ncbi:MAG: amidohydrolase family protein [Sphingomonadaceae bacterium]
MYDFDLYDTRTVIDHRVVGRGPTPVRSAQPPRARPEGISIVSVDSHILEADLWISRFPDHLKDQAPRMVFNNGGWDMIMPGEAAKPGASANFGQGKPFCELTECTPGINDVAARISDMDAEGITKELLFPQRLLARTMMGEIDLREHFFDAYNRYMAEDVCGKAPGRLYFAAVPNYWDPSEAAASINAIKALGPSACALLLPNKPRADVNGKPIVYNEYAMDSFWSAVEDSGLPICFHIGEALPDDSPGSQLTSATVNMHSLVSTWATLVHGGVFDRHPELRVVFVECGISWVPKALQDADTVYNSFDPLIRERTLHHPSWYWYNHCYASFMTDAAGLRLLDMIGADRVMWSSDYPHAEGTFGNTQDAIEAVLDAVDPKTARRILGETALELFGMK